MTILGDRQHVDICLKSIQQDMYTHTGEQLSWAEFDARRNAGEELYVGEYPKADKNQFKKFAHSHTKKETMAWLENHDFSLDIMYTNGYPDCYDMWSGECAGIRCVDGILWN